MYTAKILNPELSNVISYEPVSDLALYKKYLTFIIRMNFNLNFNGYVGIPKDHILYGMDYDTIQTKYNINVHGGLTYSYKNVAGLDAKIFKDIWWIGFDTSHYMDEQVLLYISKSNDIDKMFPKSHKVYKDFNFVRLQVQNLVNQIIKQCKKIK